MRASKKAMDRIWARVDRSGGPDACWPSRAALNSHGYAQASVDGYQTNAIRFVLAEKLGRDLAPGEQALHSCDNPPCMNPAHLRVGSGADNMRDKMQRGRHRSPRGEAHGAAVLTNEQAREIKRRLAAGSTGKSLAAAFSVSPQLICDIRHGRRWSSA